MRVGIVILTLALLVWLLLSLLSSDVGVDEPSIGGPGNGGSITSLGSGPSAEPTPGNPTVTSRSEVDDGSRLWGKAVFAGGEPVTRFWVGVLPRTDGPQLYSAPPLSLFGTIHELRDSLLAHAGVREIRTPDGRFELEEFEGSAGALFVFAEQHAALFAVGAPFGSESVFVLDAVERRKIRVLDHENDAPVVEAKLQIRSARDFDFVNQLRSMFGSKGLGFPLRRGSEVPSGVHSGVDGVIEVPLLVKVAVYERNRDPVSTRSYIPDEITVEKPGYVRGEILWEHLATPEEHVVYLDGATASLRVRIVDENNSPVLAGLLFESRARRDIELGCFTDDRGECELHDLPAGETMVRIFLPKNRPGPEKSGVLLPEQIVRDSGMDRADARELHLKPGRENVLEHRMGSKQPDPPRAYLYGSIRRNQPTDVILMNVGRGQGRMSRGLRGEEYEQPVTPGVKLTVKIEHRAIGLSEAFQVGPLADNEKHRLDIAPPRSDHLVRFRGSLAFESGAEAWLPDEVHMRVLDDREDLPRTDSAALFTKAGKLTTGAAFDLKVAPGKYRIYGHYRTNPRYTSWNWFTIRDIDVVRDVEDVRITLPVVVKFRVVPQDVSGEPLKIANGRFAIMVRSTDRPDSFRNHVMLRPGRYELLCVAAGYSPVRTNFEVGGKESVVLPVKLTPGRGAVLRGRIFDGKSKRPIARPVSISCKRSSEGYPQLYAEARMGRFEFAGLLEGEYLISVDDDDASGEPQSFRFTIQDGQVRDNLELRLGR